MKTNQRSFRAVSILLITLAAMTGFIYSYVKNKVNISEEGDSVFLVCSDTNNWCGTAFQINTKRGFRLITNKHVCENSMTMIVYKTNNYRGPSLVSVVEQPSEKYDLCVMSGLPDVKPLNFANDYYMGEKVTVIGYPLTVKSTVTGYIGFVPSPPFPPLNLGAELNFIGVTNSGNSGSPVIDSDGNVVGVINAKYIKPGADKLDPGNGCFVPLEEVKDFLNEYGY